MKFYLSGKTQKETAELFDITTQSLRKWVRQYRKGVMRRLKSRRRGRRPSGGGLRPWQ